MPFPLIGALAGLITEPLKQVLETRKIKHEANAKVLVAKAEAEIAKQAKLAQADADWETEMAKGAATSWKDEYWTIVLSIPMILSFVPGFDDIIRNGFTRLEETPEWYRYATLAAIGAAFGLRAITKFVGK